MGRASCNPARHPPVPVLPLQLFSPEFQGQFPNVTRYFVTLANQPQVVAAVGETKLATEELKYSRAPILTSCSATWAQLMGGWGQVVTCTETSPTSRVDWLRETIEADMCTIVSSQDVFVEVSMWSV